MIKYAIVLIFCSVSLFSKEFDVCKKQYVNDHLALIKREYKAKIIDIELDSATDGYAKIIYER
jgi:hypothetical protein